MLEATQITRVPPAMYIFLHKIHPGVIFCGGRDIKIPKLTNCIRMLHICYC